MVGRGCNTYVDGERYVQRMNCQLIYRIDRLRKLLDPEMHHLHKGWAVIGVYPAKDGAPPRMEWYTYASHKEPNEFDLIQRLKASGDVKKLSYFMTHAL